MKTVKIEDFDKVISDELKNLERDVGAVLNFQSEKAAKEAVKLLKASSPVRTGKYAKGWRRSKDGGSRVGSGVDTHIVYNARYYRLTHLLEYGYVHAKTGQRVGKREHIAKVEEQIIEKYQNGVLEALSDGN